MRGRFRLCRRQKGFTLIEVWVALGILAVIGVGLLSALNTNSRATRTLDEQVVASNLAVAYLEAIRELPYAATYPSAGDNITLPSQYSVNVNIQYSDDGATWSGVYSDNKTLEKITAVISREGRPVFSLCTMRTKR